MSISNLTIRSTKAPATMALRAVNGSGLNIRAARSSSEEIQTSRNGAFGSISGNGNSNTTQAALGSYQSKTQQ